MKPPTINTLLAMTASTFLLAACGGGSSGSDQDPEDSGEAVVSETETGGGGNSGTNDDGGTPTPDVSNPEETDARVGLIPEVQLLRPLIQVRATARACR